MSVLSSALRGIARHLVVAFMLISLGAYFADSGDPADCKCRDFAVRPAVARRALGVGLAAFLVTAALAGRWRR
jgi:hypothetical protein